VSSTNDETPTLVGRPDDAATIVNGAEDAPTMAGAAEAATIVGRAAARAPVDAADAATMVVDRQEGDSGGAYIPKTFGAYRIVRVLGEGGMGTVYAAEQDQPRRKVALKVIKPGMAGPELLRRFDLEAQALGRLQHPGIAQIYEAGTADTAFGSQPYFAMEFIEGLELPDHIKKHNPNMRARLKLVALVCDAVHHAHQRGLIHRDLKPRNILVTERGQPKILDFGVARATDSDAQATRQTDVGQLIGTLAYMSPEQVLADPLELDIRSDVYALGVILYETLSGQLPYNVNRKLHEAVKVIQDEEPARLSSINRVYRGDVETIVAKALEKDKSRRYASAADLAADIWRYLDDQPIVARPASTTYQLQKFARRHKALVAGVAAVFVVLIAGVAASTYQAIRATRAEQAAVQDRDRAVAAEQTAREERDRATAAEQVATEQRDIAVAAEKVATEQRNIAVVERQRADTEAATALAVNEFIQGDLLSQASVAAQIRPDTKADPDLKVRTALDRAATRIENNFNAQPLVEASIRQTIGDTYKALGLYPEAQRHLERALALQDKALPQEHRDRLHTLNNLAEVYWYQSKYDQAAPLFTAALAGRRRVLGENNRETLSTTTNVAALQWAQGKYGEAEALYTKALDSMRRVLGPEHPDALLTMNNLALLYTQQGKLAQGQPLYTTALEGRTQVLGPDHPDTLSTMSNLASLYARQGRFDQAELLFTKATDAMRRVLGEEHPETLRSANNLGFVYLSSKKVAEAEQLYSKTLDTQRRVLGNDHPDTLATMANLGLTYFAQRKFAQAEPLMVANYEGMSRRTGSAPGENRAALDQVGSLIVQLYQNLGRPDKAAEWTQRLKRP
jgi:tetratricopeptide (TPR) repeat protein/predicted Ser/Thr protein kinase